MRKGVDRGLVWRGVLRPVDLPCGQIRSLLNLVGIFEIAPYPFEKFLYTVFVVSSQNLQQQQMSRHSSQIVARVSGSPAKI